MASEPNGEIRIPVWVDGDVVKPVVNDDGRIPITIGEITVTPDVNIKSSDIDVPVSIDAASIDVPISIDSQTITVDVAEQSPLTSIQAQLYGWDLSNWHKLPMLWGFTDILHESVSATSTASGATTVYTTAVSAGYVHIYTAYGVLHTAAAPSDVFVRKYVNPNFYMCEVQASLAANRWQGGQINIIVGAGEQLSATFTATVSGETIYLQVSGYKMKVNE
jgi:hypothetical protein